MFHTFCNAELQYFTIFFLFLGTICKKNASPTPAKKTAMYSRGWLISTTSHAFMKGWK